MLMARDDRRDERDPKCNIRLMAMELPRKKAGHRPVRPTPGLVPQPADAGAGGDSSDEEQDPGDCNFGGRAESLSRPVFKHC